ncbi:branched chain amino acid aminotransferase [soil metagenome]
MKSLNSISGPRNISTALMYSFAQRDDTIVVDEPFYAVYLKKYNVPHPGQEEVLTSMENNLEKVIYDLNNLNNKKNKSICFIKNMAHHLMDMPVDFIKSWTNIFLIRDPHQILLSYAKVIQQPTMQDIGLARQYELWNWLQEEGANPVVIDSGDLLKDPPKVLNKLCQMLNIPFEPGMLSWKAGARPEDGIWAKYWYQNVHRSTGFQKPKKSTDSLPQHLEPLYLEAMKYYNFFKPHSIKA